MAISAKHCFQRFFLPHSFWNLEPLIPFTPAIWRWSCWLLVPALVTAPVLHPAQTQAAPGRGSTMGRVGPSRLPGARLDRTPCWGRGREWGGVEEVVTWSVQARRRPVLRPAMFRDPKWHESCGMPGGDASKANFSSINLPYSVEIN